MGLSNGKADYKWTVKLCTIWFVHINCQPLMPVWPEHPDNEEKQEFYSNFFLNCNQAHSQVLSGVFKRYNLYVFFSGQIV